MVEANTAYAKASCKELSERLLTLPRELRDMIIAGRAEPSFVVSQQLPLSSAPDAYARFDKREEGYTKVLLQPGEDS